MFSGILHKGVMYVHSAPSVSLSHRRQRPVPFCTHPGWLPCPGYRRLGCLQLGLLHTNAVSILV